MVISRLGRLARLGLVMASFSGELRDTLSPKVGIVVSVREM